MMAQGIAAMDLLKYQVLQNLNLAQNSTWQKSCINALYQTLQTNDSSKTSSIIQGLRDQMGHSMPINDTSSLGGISYNLCNEYCGTSKLGTVFNFDIFSNGATNYLLPWLALTAQLPFEAGENDVAANIMSFCYALGSPMLITYSLMITISNQNYVRSKFHQIESVGRPLSTKAKNIRIFLQECQQVPLRLSQQEGHLASLVILPENKYWWGNLKTSIMTTRRGVTLSLIAQILVAVLSWTLTTISVSIGSLGDPTAALVLSSGSLWIWLVPVVCGWIAAGTQKDCNTIQRALIRDKCTVIANPDRYHEVHDGSESPLPLQGRNNSSIDQSFALGATDKPWPPKRGNTLTPISPTTTFRQPSQVFGRSVCLVSKEQQAFQIAQKTRLLPLYLSSPSCDTALSCSESNGMKVPDCLGFSIAGDEMQLGPAFNFARVFTWWNMTNHLHNTLEIAAKRLQQRRNLNLMVVPEDEIFRLDDLKGDPFRMLRYCGLASDIVAPDGSTTIEIHDINEYPSWGSLDSGFYKCIIAAIAIAFFVQWGTTGAAIIISYLTKVEGLGCRSGSYMIYGVVGTTSFALLFASTFFSHAAMLQHQAIQRESVKSTDGRPDEQDPSRRVAETPCPTLLRVCAVLTRLAGRTLAVFNSLWIIVTSMFELVGFYNNCWCESTYAGKGANGWVYLFNQWEALATSARSPWAGSVSLTVVVCLSSLVIFWLYCRGNRV
ncbi:hypothetical protein F4775DRAFT_577351 [Biscogniauxia sp. FL1348]|nr:hypothetical protein F4775DRAFT_577351 [Biscogniauxia sp. FL1348]